MLDIPEDLFVDSIVVFGCSFSCGVGKLHNYENWPYYLRSLQDNKIVNLSRGGTSFAYSVNLLEYISRNYEFSPKHVVFQITNPMRKSFRYEDFGPDDYNSEHPNGMSDGSTNSVAAISSGWYTEAWHEDYFLAEDKNIIQYTEDRALLAYTKQLLLPYNNTLFSQIHIAHLNDTVDFNMEEYLGGREEYNRRVIDNGMHLDNKTLMEQAHYINSFIV